MRKKVVVLNGSPRKNGNASAPVKAFIQADGLKFNAFVTVSCELL